MSFPDVFCLGGPWMDDYSLNDTGLELEVYPFRDVNSFCNQPEREKLD